MKLKKIMVFLLFNMLAFVGKTAYTEASSTLRLDTEDAGTKHAAQDVEGTLLAYSNLCSGLVGSTY
ncbi:MAG: hypothetical protein VZR95_07280 [Alphaproteobacteria bacterium]